MSETASFDGNHTEKKNFLIDLIGVKVAKPSN